MANLEEDPIQPNSQIDVPPSSPASDESHFLGPYFEHAKTLRSWYVAYGIGAPVLFVSQPTVWSKIKLAGFGQSVLLYFLIGSLLQVVLTLMNKIAMWANYYSERNPDYTKEKCFFDFFKWYSGIFWFDIAIDLFSMLLFGRATWLVFKAFIYLP